MGDQIEKNKLFFTTASGRIQQLLYWNLTRLTFTCSKSTIETLDKLCEICSKLGIKALD